MYLTNNCELSGHVSNFGSRVTDVKILERYGDVLGYLYSAGRLRTKENKSD